MFGDQPEAADIGRNCEICKVQLETETPWCECCTEGESSLWDRLEQLKISSGESTVMSILTQWSEGVPRWNLQRGLEMLIRPSNRRFPRTTRPKLAPFVVIEGIDSSGKTTHVDALAATLSQLQYSVRVITFPNNLTPLGSFLKHILQTGSSLECWTQHVLFSLHRWEMMDLIQDLLLTGTAVIDGIGLASGMINEIILNEVVQRRSRQWQGDQQWTERSRYQQERQDWGSTQGWTPHRDTGSQQQWRDQPSSSQRYQDWSHQSQPTQGGWQDPQQGQSQQQHQQVTAAQYWPTQQQQVPTLPAPTYPPGMQPSNIQPPPGLGPTNVQQTWQGATTQNVPIQFGFVSAMRGQGLCTHM